MSRHFIPRCAPGYRKTTVKRYTYSHIANIRCASFHRGVRLQLVVSPPKGVSTDFRTSVTLRPLIENGREK